MSGDLDSRGRLSEEPADITIARRTYGKGGILPRHNKGRQLFHTTSGAPKAHNVSPISKVSRIDTDEI